MISPSETTLQEMGPVAGARKKPWSPGWRTEGSVLPLEFKAIEHPLRAKGDWIPAAEEERRDLRLREELERLESRFHTQTEQMTERMAEVQRSAKDEARREWEAELAERLSAERRQIAVFCAEFAKARDSYFAAVEGEVVRLALAIAARVLHREAKLDPLLLSAVVRMALEKVEEKSGVALHVPAASVDAWRSQMAADAESVVRVVGEERMDAADCVLETSVGRVELGVVAQLEEIEKGFFDLLQQRPA